MPERPSNPATDSTLASAPGPPPPAGVGVLGPGTIVAGTYEIVRLLGQGGMGAVWEAKHLRLPDKRVVVKVLLFGTTDAVTLARFRREAEIASRLGHPNIVQVLDFNTLPDGAPFIVLELLQGESLAAKSGSLRYVTDRQKPPTWMQGKKKLTLTIVPIESVDEKSGEPINNYQLIYNELGVYLGEKLGNPCDDL